MKLPKQFLDRVYDVPQLAERLDETADDIYQRIKMHTVVPPYWLTTDIPLWSRRRIEDWIQQGMPAREMVEHRREMNTMLAASMGLPPALETIPSEHAVVGMAADGSLITEDDRC